MAHFYHQKLNLLVKKVFQSTVAESIFYIFLLYYEAMQLIKNLFAFLVSTCFEGSSFISVCFQKPNWRNWSNNKNIFSFMSSFVQIDSCCNWFTDVTFCVMNSPLPSCPQDVREALDIEKCLIWLSYLACMLMILTGENKLHIIGHYCSFLHPRFWKAIVQKKHQSHPARMRWMSRKRCEKEIARDKAE